jgi:hypothetical protein
MEKFRKYGEEHNNGLDTYVSLGHLVAASIRRRRTRTATVTISELEEP